MLDKAKLGTRYTCYKCGTKFYDLHRPLPTCPECSADQRDAPTRDIRSLLGGKGPVRRTKDEDEVEESPVEEDEEMGLLDEEDEEDDDAPELDEDEEEEEGGAAGAGGGGGGGGGGGEDDW